jgi:hypothetical protein
MNTFKYHLALGIVLMTLEDSVKNPKSIETERAVLSEIRDLLDILLMNSAQVSNSNKLLLPPPNPTGIAAK